MHDPAISDSTSVFETLRAFRAADMANDDMERGGYSLLNTGTVAKASFSLCYDVKSIQHGSLPLRAMSHNKL